MKKRIAFTFDENAYRSLKNVLDQQLDDYTKIVIKHPVHGDDQEVLIPNIRIGDSETINEYGNLVERMTVDVVHIENKISHCKKMVDEMMRTGNADMLPQLQADLAKALEKFSGFHKMEYWE